MWDLEFRAWVLGFRGLGKPKKDCFEHERACLEWEPRSRVGR